MGLPQVTYDPGTGPITLLFNRGPQDFRCFYKARVHDNVATSGVKERIVEALDMLITFNMLALKISDDLPAWTLFSAFALGGGQFSFWPNVAVNVQYHAVSDDQDFVHARVGPGVYTAAFNWRIVIDSLAPANPSVVLQHFYGL